KREFAGSVRFKLDQRRTQVDREAGRVQLDRLGKVKFRVTEELIGRLRSVTISRDSAGRFFMSFTADQVPVKSLPAPQVESVGIDQGVKTLLVTSANERTAVSRALEVKAYRLRRYQRSQARKLRAAMVKAGLDPSKPIPKGIKLQKSKRFERNRRRIARLHAQVGDARRDLLHKATTSLIERHALIGIENLNVKGIMKGLPRVRRLAGNACMGEVRRQLKYKAAWYERKLILVDRFFPSSQLCSDCGWQYKELKLSQRSWQCAQCGAHHDRDHNAAKNILAEALRLAALEAGYPEEPGKLSTGSAVDSAEAIGLRPGLGTTNREL